MDLLRIPWLPVRRSTGSDWIAPWQLTDPVDPVLDFDAARPDFNAALWQFCIGLLATLMPPTDPTERRERLNAPPSPDILKTVFERYAYAFQLDGDGPRFMQDFDARMGGAVAPVAGLVIETPGDKTIRDNADHFIKRDRIDALCPACAASALMTLQANAPAGGAGHRTSLRGGGPLTTLLRFSPQARADAGPITLWQQLWLNVPEGRVSPSPEQSWPWLEPTRTSIKSEVVTELDVPATTAYWATPRRIRLIFVDQSGLCSLCGRRDERLVREYVTRPHGANYKGWLHPLSPYYRVKTDEPWLPQHPQPGGLGYRHWPALMYGNADATARPAAVIGSSLELARRPGSGWHREAPLRLWAFGFDMDNMKARSWHEADMPVHAIEDAGQLGMYAGLLQQLVEAAGLVRLYATGAVRRAWFGEREVRGDLSVVDQAFWGRTENAFFELAADARGRVVSGTGHEPLRRRWLEILQRTARELFDERAANAPMSEADPAAIAVAYNDLQKKLRGPKLLKLLDLASDTTRGDGRRRKAE